MEVANLMSLVGQRDILELEQRVNSVVKSVRGRARSKAVCSEDEPNNKKPSVRRPERGRHKVAHRCLV